MIASWFARYGAYGLLAAGGAIFSVIIPSAAGPADVLPRERLVAPVTLSAARPGQAPLLISSGATTVQASALVQPTPASAPPLVAPAGVEIPVLGVVEALPAALQAVPVLPPTDRMVVPRLGLDIKVVDVGVLPNGEMDTAAYAAGRLVFSAEAGEEGNVVLAGHNDILGEVFRRLPDFIVGDDVVLFRGDARYVYRVEGRTIVREVGASDAQRRENARWMDPTDDSVVTLISCYPYRVDTHRYIVRARLVA